MKRFVATLSSGLSAILALILLVLSAEVGLAQRKPAQKPVAVEAPPAASQWLSINVVRVKPDMLTEFEDFSRREITPAMKKIGVKERTAWATGVFGEAFEYVFVTPIDDWAQYDAAPSQITKALGEEGARKARRFIESVHTYAVQTRPDLSYMGKMTGPPKLAVVNWLHIAPGRTAEFENLLKTEIVPAMKKADVRAYLVSRTVHGGDTNEYVSLTFMDSYAEIGKEQPIVRGMGQAAFNRFVPKTAGIITHHERSIARYVPELSFEPAAKADNK